MITFNTKQEAIFNEAQTAVKETASEMSRKYPAVGFYLLTNPLFNLKVTLHMPGFSRHFLFPLSDTL